MAKSNRTGDILMAETVDGIYEVELFESGESVSVYDFHTNIKLELGGVMQNLCGRQREWRNPPPPRMHKGPHAYVHFLGKGVILWL